MTILFESYASACTLSLCAAAIWTLMTRGVPLNSSHKTIVHVLINVIIIMKVCLNGHSFETAYAHVVQHCEITMI